MAERYSKQRYLSSLGITQGPRGADVSGLAAAQNRKTQSVQTGLTAIQKILIEKSTKNAEKNAARRAVDNDPYLLISQTEGSTNLEDELTRKHAITKIKNNTLDDISLKAALAEKDAIANDDDSNTFNATLNSIVQNSFVSLRESGVDAPLLELELKENMAAPFRQMVTRYGSNRVTNKQKLYTAELKKDGQNIAIRAGQTGETTKFNEWKEDNKDFVNSNPGYASKIATQFNVNRSVKFANDVAWVVGNSQSYDDLIAAQKAIKEFKDTLPINPDARVLANLDIANSQINFKAGDGQTALAIAKLRKENNASIARSEEAAFTLSNVSAAASFIDIGIAKGIITNKTSIEEIIRNTSIVLQDENTSPPTEIMTVNREFVGNYVREALAEYQESDTDFVENRMDMESNAITEGSLHTEKLISRNEAGLSLVSNSDIKTITTNMDLDQPIAAISYLQNLMGSSGPYQAGVYTDLMAKLPEKHKSFIRFMSIGIDMDTDFPDRSGKKHIQIIAQGYYNKKLAQSEGRIDEDLTTTREDYIEKELARILPPSINSGGDKSQLYYSYFNAMNHYIWSSGQELPDDKSGLEDILDKITGYEERNGEVISGFVDTGYGKVFLESDKRNKDNSVTDRDIQSAIVNLSDDIFYAYTNKLDFQSGQLVPSDERLKVDNLAFNVSGAISGTEIEITADKLRNNFTFKNTDKSHYILEPNQTLPMADVVTQLFVAQDDNGNILRYSDNNPVLFDLKNMGVEYKELFEQRPFANIDRNLYKISDVTAATKYTTGRVVNVESPVSRQLRRPAPTKINKLSLILNRRGLNN